MTRTAHLFTTAGFVALALAFAWPATARADDRELEKYDDVRVSAVSGYSGNADGYKARGLSSPDSKLLVDQPVVGLSIYESFDKPCSFRLWSRSINDVFAKPYKGPKHTHETCKSPADGSKKTVKLGDRYYIHGIQVCTNKKRNSAKTRLKGVKLFGAVVDDDGDVTKKKITATYKQAHCQEWHKVVRCGKDRIAYGFEFHAGDKGINGIALRCYKIKDVHHHVRPGH